MWQIILIIINFLQLCIELKKEVLHFKRQMEINTRKEMNMNRRRMHINRMHINRMHINREQN